MTLNDISLIDAYVDQLSEQVGYDIDFLKEFSPKFRLYESVDDFIKTGLITKSDYENLKNNLISEACLLTEEEIPVAQINKIDKEIRKLDMKQNSQLPVSIQKTLGGFGLLGKATQDTLLLKPIKTGQSTMVKQGLSNQAKTQAGSSQAQMIGTGQKSAISSTLGNIQGYGAAGALTAVARRIWDDTMKKYKACLTRCKKQTQQVLLFFTYKGDAYQICMNECQIEKLKTKLNLMQRNKKILNSITDPRKRSEQMKKWQESYNEIQEDINKKQQELEYRRERNKNKQST